MFWKLNNTLQSNPQGKEKNQKRNLKIFKSK